VKGGSADDLVERLLVLRDEVLDTVEHGDRDPPGQEVFDALVRGLSAGGESLAGVDLAVHDAVARRLAWGDTEEIVLADCELVYDRIVIAVERAFRDPDDQLTVIEAATQVAVGVARVVAMAAVARAGRDRAARMREELTQRQLHAALEQQRENVTRLEKELREGSSSSDF
jgi:hypothetical protein